MRVPINQCPLVLINGRVIDLCSPTLIGEVLVKCVHFLIMLHDF